MKFGAIYLFIYLFVHLFIYSFIYLFKVEKLSKIQYTYIQIKINYPILQNTTNTIKAKGKTGL